MQITLSILISLILGVAPAILWLKFWLKEDEKHPEPNRFIIRTFLLGIFVVPFAIIIQFIIHFFLLGSADLSKSVSLFNPLAILVVILLPLIEEIVKFFAAYFGGISKKANNEPIDATMYMITAALGFSAFENVLFGLTPLINGQFIDFILNNNLRIIGAMLLHVASSGIVGIFISLSYKKSKKIQIKNVVWGLICATLLHSLFNFLIIMSKNFSVYSFVLVWIVLVCLILLLEKVRTKYYKQ